MVRKTLAGRQNTSTDEIDVTGRPAEQQAMSVKARGRRSVPQIFIGETHVGGCDDLYELERAGELDPLLKAG